MGTREEINAIWRNIKINLQKLVDVDMNCHLYLAAQRRAWLRRNFVKMFDADKTRMIGLPYGEKNYDNMLAVFIQYRNVTDMQTDIYGRT